MAKILIVDDEPKICRFLELELTHEGYEVEVAYDGRVGLERAIQGGADLILLDIMLPGLNGLEVLRRVRRELSVPIILLTARDEVMDKVGGLDGGADDYITKPFAIEELLARVRLALRRAPSQIAALPLAGEGTEGVLAVASLGVSLDVDAHELRVGDEVVDLTNREFEVLRSLLLNKNRVMSRDQLLQAACGYDFSGGTNTIDVHVRHLREKIDDRFGIKLISTVRGVGYVIRES